MIKFNSKSVGGSEVVIRPGSRLILRCEGDGPVHWHPRLKKHKRHVSKGSGNVRTLKVDSPTAEFTGTYTCSYTAESKDSNLTSSVHVYVKGELD